VDWHYAAGEAPTIATALDEGSAGIGAAAWAGGGCILAGLGCGGAWLRRRRKRRAAGAAGHPTALAPAERPFAFLERVDDDALLAALGAEPLDAVALILAHLPAERTARLLGGLAPRVQVEVTGRIAKLSDPPADEVWGVREALAARFRPDGTLKDGPVGGVSAAAEILERAGYATEQSVLGELGRREPILAESIRRRMFAFEDIALLPAARLGRVLESIDDGELAVALRTTDEGLQGRVLAALSPRAAARVRQEMDRIGPVRLRDVEVAQQHVAESILRMDAGGYLAGAPEPDREVLA
jgi:flagellar motor switch protein FliG